MKRIAEVDAAKAAEYGKESVKGGIESRHIELLKKIYAKDVDKGIEFGAAILSKVKGGKDSVKGIYVYGELLSFAASNFEESKKLGGKKPVYQYGDVRDIAELLAKVLLDGDDSDGYASYNYLENIAKYAPTRAAQIRVKFKKLGMGNSNSDSLRTIETIETASSNSSLAANSSAAATRANEEKLTREKREKDLMEGIIGLGKKELSKEERDKVIAQSRKIISQTPGKDKKIAALSMLAAQVAHAGDKDLADEIMRDAERLVNPQAKNYQDFLLSLMLAAGYAEVDPDKAFPVLEALILRQNDLSAASIKLAEFIDVNSELIQDGEIQIGLFGGEMIRGMITGLGIATPTIRTLAKADFAKTRNLTNTFDRTETRVLAKMLVLRAVLDKKETSKQSEDELMKDYTSEPGGN